MDLDVERMMTANISLDIFSMILSFIPIVYLLSGKRYKLPINLYFLGVAVSNVLMILGDLSDWTLQTSAEPWQKNLLLIGSILFYVSSAFLLFFFVQYITVYMRITGRINKFCLTFVTLMCATQIFLTLLSPFTGWFFYITDTGYQRGPLFIVSQIIPLSCYFLFTVLVIAYRKKLKWREVVFFLLYIFIPLSGNFAQIFLRGIAVVNVGVSLALLLILVNIQFEHEMVQREQEKKLTEQRVEIMLSQIQPHFLYNSLGAIYRLCETDPAKARMSIKKFSDFLRGNMDSLKAREPIPFEKELEHVKNYLYLEQQRFGEKLQVIYQIEEDDFLIPPLTLQPLVENAVQHGILHKREGGTITISSQNMEDCAVVTVTDDGVGMEKAKEYPNLGNHAHIGISNVRSRLEEMVNGSLEVKSGDTGTVVTLRIPWEEGF